MAYIGNPPADRYSKLAKQDLTGDGTVGPYTLDYAVGGVAEIEVFVNNVRQEPTTAYTVAGDQLTMTGTVASTDDFYVVFQGKAIASGQVPEKQSDGSYVYLGNVDINGNDLILDADADSKIEASTDDTINIISGGTIGLTVDSSGRVLQPQKVAFMAKITTNFNPATASRTLIPFATNNSADRVFDYGSNFNNTDSKFVAPVDGLYFFMASAYVGSHSSSYYHILRFELNGIGLAEGYSIAQFGSSSLGSQHIHCYVNLTAGDSIDCHTQSGGDTSYDIEFSNSHFSGHLIG